MGLLLTPSAALPLDPAGDSAAHSSPCTFSITPPAELRQNKQPKRSPHHYICDKSLLFSLPFSTGQTAVKLSGAAAADRAQCAAPD